MRLIRFIEPFDRPCVPDAEIALKYKPTIISSDSPKASNSPNPCMKWSFFKFND